MSNKYNFGGEDKEDEIHKEIERKLDKIEDEEKTITEIKQLDELNPLERAEKFEEIKKNPPQPGYMDVKVYGGTNKNTGEPVVVSISKGPKGDGDEKVILHNPIMPVDLNTSVKADIAACPSSVIPMVIDERLQLQADEKKEYKPRKRKPEFNWGWVLILMLMVPAIVFVILYFLL